MRAQKYGEVLEYVDAFAWYAPFIMAFAVIMSYAVT